jgi:diguanylate cyclase (GGDEF)-like protein
MTVENIYVQFENILKHQYVDIERTRSKLIAIKKDAVQAGQEFEYFRLICLNNLDHQHGIAIDYANRALIIAKEKKDLFLLEKINTELGFIAYNRGDLEKCMTYYLEVLKYAQSPRVINNIGAIFDDLGDMDEAYRYYKQAEEVFDDPENFRLLAIIYSNIGECETAFGNYDEAKRYLDLSRKEIRKFTDNDGTVYIFNAFGDLALLQEKYDEAIEYYTKGEEYSKDEEILVYYQKFILNHARTLFQKGDLDKSKEKIELLFDKSNSYSFDTDIAEIHELLGKIADGKGQIEVANKHYKKYIDLIRRKDEISKKNRSESIKASIKISQLTVQLNKLSKMSRSDLLTKLGNRYALMEYIENWSKIQLDSSIVIAVIDVDFFKSHNDTFGHSHGDACLAEVASILIKSLPKELGSVFRYGGDEFLMIIKDYAKDMAYEKLEEIRKKVENIESCGKSKKMNKKTITCSIGAVSIEKNSQQPFEELFDIADRALYISKEQGRNITTILDSK